MADFHMATKNGIAYGAGKDVVGIKKAMLTKMSNNLIF